MKVLLLGVVMFFSLNMYAQKDHCGTSHVMKALYKARPASKIEAENLNKFARNFASQKSTKAAGEYVIPIVFHVYGTNFNGQSVNDAIIKDALQKTNEDFQGLTADWNDIIPEFDGVKKALNITFKLAQIDPSGNPTTGINYYANASGFGNGSGYDAQIQQHAWDNYKYFNVYIQNDLYNDGATNNSGVCWYPDTWMSDNNLARCVYNGAYLGTNTNENFRSVLTHEFGHYLNLIHTFEGGCPDAGSCSTSGDQICDTPPADNSSMNGALNCQGVVTNWENFMDYTNNYSMFTVDQVARMEAALQHAARFTLWQEANLVATGVNANLGARLVISSNIFDESYLNNGTVSTTATISAIDGAQFAASGNLTQGTHYTVANLPSGLSVQISVTSSTSATVSISGSAGSHANANDIANMSITFLNPAIVGGTSGLYSASLNNLTVNFIDPYQIIYENIADISVNSVDTWVWFAVQNGDAFGIWYDAGKLRIETYGKSLISEGSTRNISLLPYNTPIESGSNWVAGGAYPDEHDLRSNSYTVWDGQTAYIGFQIDINGHPCNGWFKVTVSANGSSFTLSEYAYNEEPYATILAGTTDGGGGGDTEAPSTPGNLTSSNITQTGLNLNWTASTDNVGVIGYDVYQNGSIVKSANSNSTSISGLSANTNYTFAVRAKDAAGNVSNQSNSINVTTLGNNDDGGELINGVTANGTMDQTDDSDMWYIDVAPNATSMEVILVCAGSDFDTYGKAGSAPTKSVYDWRGYTSGGEENTVNNPQEGRYYIMVDHYSGSGAYNLTATITYATTDTEAPTAPTGLASSNIGTNSVDLSWTASTDNVGVTAYDVYQGSSVIQTVSGTNVSVSNLLASTQYNFSVKAKDAAGNVSAASNTVSVTTTGGGTTTYCDATGINGPEHIARVQVASIDNSSARTTYTDYTNISTSMSRNSSHAITVTIGDIYNGDKATAWVDWNVDGDFEDAGEKFALAVAGSKATGTITVPSNATIGQTTMRVRVFYYSAGDNPCGSQTYGEVEDYTISVNASAAGATGVESLSLINARVFPNPATDILVIQVEDGTADKYELINLTGQSMLMKEFTSDQEKINISELQKGMYILKISSQNNSILKKVIIE